MSEKAAFRLSSPEKGQASHRMTMGGTPPPYASHCGHDPALFVTADEGTSHCPACEAYERRAVRLEDPQATRETGS